MQLSCGDHALALADGRTLGYSVFGDPAGLPVVNCHGGLVSGHDVSPAHELARALELCVISPDRPGINHTDRLPNHGLLQWVRKDLVPLLDHLEVGPIGVMGWSEGGQYALAAAYGLGRGSRVARSLLVVRPSMIPPPSSGSITSIAPSSVLLAEHRSCFVALERPFGLLRNTPAEHSYGSRCADNRVVRPRRSASRGAGFPGSWLKAQRIPADLSTSISPSPLRGASDQTT